MAAELPEPDRTPGAPHPRETPILFGQDDAEAGFLSAWAQGRLHHAWMLTGGRGVGKATLAWKIARFLLSRPAEEGGLFDAPPPPDSLDTDPETPLARRMRALAEPRLFLLRRSANQTGSALSQVITVDDTRRLKDFLHHSAADGGWRVVIIDALDEMNVSSANALLKLLEEPPPRALFLLVSHQPARLLPTIRSRCRELRLAALDAEALSDALVQAGGEIDPADRTALAELAAGSVGEAFRLTNLSGLAIYRDLVGLFQSLPRLDRPQALALAEKAAARGAEERFDLTLTLIDLFLTRLSRAAATRLTPPEAAPDEAALFARLAPSGEAARPWADLAQSLTQRARRGRAVNLDPGALLMDTLLRIDATAQDLARQPAR
ncbi:DNA polymerase III subunit delta' [Pseudogemmobacter sonorensis]|uniref:DNA polymerase III subunit delta' n=1 Tax=Pseudogemmobacter sonorensis TaxID=2989681 RepID=UPI0036A3E953